MTPCQKIKREILLQALENLKSFPDDAVYENEKALLKSLERGITDETVNEQYDALVDMDIHWDYESEFRGGTVETNLPCDYSRHYESKSVARKLSDGSWVGWTYWYGGGKHGEPGSVQWMEDAYDLEVTETEKMVLVREFKKI